MQNHFYKLRFVHNLANAVERVLQYWLKCESKFTRSKFTMRGLSVKQCGFERSTWATAYFFNPANNTLKLPFVILTK